MYWTVCFSFWQCAHSRSTWVLKTSSLEIYTTKIPYGEIFERWNIIRRNFLTSKFPHDQISLHRNFLTVKFPTARLPTANFSTAKFPFVCPFNRFVKQPTHHSTQQNSHSSANTLDKIIFNSNLECWWRKQLRTTWWSYFFSNKLCSIGPTFLHPGGQVLEDFNPLDLWTNACERLAVEQGRAFTSSLALISEPVRTWTSFSAEVCPAQ